MLAASGLRKQYQVRSVRDASIHVVSGSLEVPANERFVQPPTKKKSFIHCVRQIPCANRLMSIDYNRLICAERNAYSSPVKQCMNLNKHDTLSRSLISNLPELDSNFTELTGRVR